MRPNQKRRANLMRNHHVSSAETPAVNVGAQAEPQTAVTGWARIASRVGAYVALTKPRIIELLLVTTLPTMILAERGFPSIWLVVATLIGGTLAAGSANALNCYFDRDIDVVMHRTKRRPLVTGEITPRARSEERRVGNECRSRCSPRALRKET